LIQSPLVISISKRKNKIHVFLKWRRQVPESWYSLWRVIFIFQNLRCFSKKFACLPKFSLFCQNHWYSAEYHSESYMGTFSGQAGSGRAQKRPDTENGGPGLAWPGPTVGPKNVCPGLAQVRCFLSGHRAFGLGLPKIFQKYYPGLAQVSSRAKICLPRPTHRAKICGPGLRFSGRAELPMLRSTVNTPAAAAPQPRRLRAGNFLNYMYVYALKNPFL
jgi:hypothetical protein